MKKLQSKRSRKRKTDKNRNQPAPGFVPPPVQPDLNLLPLFGNTPPIAEGPKTPPPLPPIVAKFSDENPKLH